MSNTPKDNTSNLKIGLIFLKSKVTDQGCVQNLNKVDATSPCKRHDKWIVVAGNSYNINIQEGHKCLLHQDEVDESRLHKHCQDFILSTGSHILDQPMLQKNIVEMHLDSVFKDKATALSLELFKCVNVRVLSLRHNNIVSLPADIGRLSHLRTLVLTENCLTINTIPYTLTFCRELRELYLDHNLLDALPGFLLDMPRLHTVYRHGNHNYFKSTFMWYHTAKGDRVMPLRNRKLIMRPEVTMFEPQSLESISIRALIAAKINFFSPGLLPVTLQDYVAKVYQKYKICAYCSVAYDDLKPGFRVFTFKNPYLGNTCVPFEHWTCCRDCGVALEEPAHKLERAQARKLEHQYQQYIKSVQDQLCQKAPDKWPPSCVLM